ncbi:BTAD domain-containing putative transcriptional regulator [Micromonospora sp. WMMA1923]|uniref:AfsR/SARP family transcriptional regulator n=1 Tax=Micromonospora sp. WMMA1923 TaxID=3404125 RepID=UPI003B942AD1
MLGVVCAGNGSTTYDLGPAKQRALFAALALQPGEFLPVATLSQLLWGDIQPANAGHLLHTYIARLRRSVEPEAPRRSRTAVICSGPGGYQLSTHHDNADLVRFRQLVRTARRLLPLGHPRWAFHLFHLAVLLWEDPELVELRSLLPGHPIIDTLQREWVDAALEYVTLGLRLDRAEAVLATAERLAAVAPLHEAVQARYLSVLAGTRQLPAALDRYAELRARLAADAGIAPGPELVDTYRHLWRAWSGVDDVPASHPAGHPCFPPSAPGTARPPEATDLDTTDLDTRDRDTVDLDTVVRSLATQRLVTLVGPADSGRTATARSIARRASAILAAHRVATVDVTTTATRADLVGFLLRQLDPPGTTEPSTDQCLLRVLAHRRLLVVLDDVDHLADDCADLVDLIVRNCRGVSVVVTARQPLGLSYEAVRRLRCPSAGTPGRPAAGDPLRRPAQQLSRAALWMLETVRLVAFGVPASQIWLIPARYRGGPGPPRHGTTGT